MARVENEVSEEENEIEVIIEEDDGCEQDPDNDESDDEGSDEEEALEQRVSELEQSIADDPYVYSEHIELIQALWKLTELDRWRAAFDKLQKMSALLPKHWLLRLSAELSLPHARLPNEDLLQLFHQATADCYCVEVVVEWCRLAVSAWRGEAARARLLEAAERGSADPLAGKLLLDLVREHDQAALDSLTAESPEYEAAARRVADSLEQALSRPLLHSGDTWPLFTQVVSQLDDPDYVDKVKKQHEEAQDVLAMIAPFEDTLLTLEAADEKLSVYSEYIETVSELARDPHRYQACRLHETLLVLYDRATSECGGVAGSFTLAQGWARHCRLHAPAQLSRVLRACVRRHPRRAAFHVATMELLEHEGKDLDEIKAVLESALETGLESASEYGAVWGAYLQFLRRRTLSAPTPPDERAVERLRATFRLAADNIAETWGSECEEVAEVLALWARLEYRQLLEHKRGKELIEELFQYGENKTQVRWWELLAGLERARTPAPSAHKLRELHARALRSVRDYPPAAARLWTHYEQEHGSLDGVRQCREACEAKLLEWREQCAAAKEKKFANLKQKNKKFDKKNKDKHNAQTKDKHLPGKERQGKRTVKREEGKGVKRRASPGEQAGGKRERGDYADADEQTDAPATDRVNGSPFKRPHELDKDDGESESKKARSTRNGSAESSESASSRTNSGSREDCTLFVSNLDVKLDEGALREALSRWGEVVALRLSRSVKSFGGAICYCEYATPESVERALQHDREPLDGRPMFLSRHKHNTPGEGKQARFKYATHAERDKLFVRNLPFESCTRAKLSELFAQYGALRDVRVVTHKDGRPKGLAYIEYESEADAAAALKATQGLLVGSRHIEVALSAPPPRVDVAAPSTSLGRNKPGTGGMKRTQLSSLVPRVLQTPVASTSSSTGASPEPTASAPAPKPLSNSDFRSMLLNNK